MADPVEKLFGDLKSRLFGNERKLDPNKINNLGSRQFGNARRFRLKPGFSGVFQHPQPFPEVRDAGGGSCLTHGRYVTFQMAEVAVSRNLFREILRRIDESRRRPAPA